MAPGCYASHCNEFLLTSLVAGGGGERTLQRLLENVRCKPSTALFVKGERGCSGAPFPVPPLAVEVHRGRFESPLAGQVLPVGSKGTVAHRAHSG